MYLEVKPVGLLLLILILLGACSPESTPNPAVSLQQALGSESGSGSGSGFLHAHSPREFDFPADHGPHNGFRNEWWYITGNVAADQGQRFGFQVTFFRFALRPQSEMKRRSKWATNQFWMAHVALTDPTTQKHIATERFSREALGLAGVRTDPFDLWVGDWKIFSASKGFPWRLNVNTDKFSLDLEFAPLTSPILQGEQGLSQKSTEKGNASYYYSVSRLQSEGAIRFGENNYTVSGLSWLDREWSSSALGPDQVGWDWFSMQIDDGTDLMFYRLRNRQQETDVHSGGSIVDANGVQTNLHFNDIDLKPKRWWKSRNGANYPVAWELEIKPLHKQWLVEAVVDQQEMDFSVRYWEGMVSISENGAIIGRGYLEMTGYE